MPTDHGCRRLREPQNGYHSGIRDRTAEPVRPTVGVGLLLLSLASAGTVVRASLAAMTDSTTSPSSGPPARELADIPAVEVISRAAGEQAIRVALDDGQDVVKIVGHASGQLADGLELLGMAELGL